jgi:hypothetical protein
MKLKLVHFLILTLTAVFLAQLVLLSKPSTVTALPPRPTPTAVPAPQVTGAQISLHVEGPHDNDVWTMVQWQDAQNMWHDVAGWQGELESDGTKTWWVGQEILGTGPYRWVLLADDVVAGKSSAFSLPIQPFTTLVVIVSLE